MSETNAVTTLELLKNEVARILNVEVPSSDVPLAEIGVDSLNVVELLLFCDQLYGSVDMDSLDIGHFTTLKSLDEQLRRKSVVQEPAAQAT
jgi:acyl carrier protein